MRQRRRARSVGRWVDLSCCVPSACRLATEWEWGRLVIISRSRTRGPRRGREPEYVCPERADRSRAHNPFPAPGRSNTHDCGLFCGESPKISSAPMSRRARAFIGTFPLPHGPAASGQDFAGFVCARSGAGRHNNLLRRTWTVLTLALGILHDSTHRCRSAQSIPCRPLAASRSAIARAIPPMRKGQRSSCRMDGRRSKKFPWTTSQPRTQAGCRTASA